MGYSPFSCKESDTVDKLTHTKMWYTPEIYPKIHVKQNLTDSKEKQTHLKSKLEILLEFS